MHAGCYLEALPIQRRCTSFRQRKYLSDKEEGDQHYLATIEKKVQTKSGTGRGKEDFIYYGAIRTEDLDRFQRFQANLCTDHETNIVSEQEKIQAHLKAVQPLLSKFKNILINELLDRLSFIRDILHHIDLVLGASLPNLPPL